MIDPLPLRTLDIATVTAPPIDYVKPIELKPKHQMAKAANGSAQIFPKQVTDHFIIPDGWSLMDVNHYILIFHYVQFRQQQGFEVRNPGELSFGI